MYNMSELSPYLHPFLTARPERFKLTDGQLNEAHSLFRDTWSDRQFTDIFHVLGLPSQSQLEHCSSSLVSRLSALPPTYCLSLDCYISIPKRREGTQVVMASRSGRRSTPAARTPSAISSMSSNRNVPSRSGASSHSVRVRSTPPIFSSPLSHSRQELNRALGSTQSPASGSSMRSSPALPPYPQARTGRVSLPPRSSASFKPVRHGGSSLTYPDDSEPDVVNEIIMAIDMKENGTIGCAYYVALDEALFLLQDIPLAGIELVEMLILHVEPTTVLVSIRGPDNLIESLEAGAQDSMGNRDQEGWSLNPLPSSSRLTQSSGGIRGAYILRTVGSVEFSYENAKSHLLNINFDSLSTQTMRFITVSGNEAEGEVDMAGQRQGKLMRLATWIDLDSRFSVSLAILSELFVSSLIEDRLAAPEQSSVIYNAEKPPSIFPTT